MSAESKAGSSRLTALENREERLVKIREDLRRALLELDELGLHLAGALLDGVIVALEGELDQGSR